MAVVESLKSDKWTMLLPLQLTTLFEDDVTAVFETARLRLLPSCSSCISASAAAEVDATTVAEVDAAGAGGATGVDLAIGAPKERLVSFDDTVCTLSASLSLWASSLF